MTEAVERPNRGPYPWIEAAYELLAQHGHSAVTIEQLTAQTSKTRGSFYHHFGNIEGFVGRLVADWRERNTERIVHLAAALHEPGARRSFVHREAVQLDVRVETALRIWAGLDPQVRAVCVDVDIRRMNVLSRHLADLAKGMGCDLSDLEAGMLARIEYAAFVGAQMLAPDTSRCALFELGKMYEDMLNAYLTHRQAGQNILNLP